jgi:hypothetical protein
MVNARSNDGERWWACGQRTCSQRPRTRWETRFLRFPQVRQDQVTSSLPSASGGRIVRRCPRQESGRRGPSSPVHFLEHGPFQSTGPRSELNFEPLRVPCGKTLSFYTRDKRDARSQCTFSSRLLSTHRTTLLCWAWRRCTFSEIGAAVRGAVAQEDYFSPRFALAGPLELATRADGRHVRSTGRNPGCRRFRQRPLRGPDEQATSVVATGPGDRPRFNPRARGAPFPSFLPHQSLALTHPRLASWPFAGSGCGSSWGRSESSRS